MKKDPYEIVSKIYDSLMSSISYYEWGRYIVDLKEEYHPRAKSFLEIAAGSGRLAFYLRQKFSNLVLLDLSKSMLALIDKGEKRVCADMTLLPFKNKFDFIYSTFDSVNYLDSKNKLEKYFKEISNILNNDGFFTFDASLENNSISNVKHLNRKGKFQNISYTQFSKYDFDKKVHLNKFTVEFENGEIFKEIHLQKIYDFEIYFELAERAGLYVVDCFDAFTFDDAGNDSERVQFVLQKIN